jgi:SAM-dependent methyltransferase
MGSADASSIIRNDDRNVVAAWDDAHRYTPAPRHRRRLLLKILDGLEFDDVLDAGCAQPFLLGEMVQRYGVVGYGCDLSDQVVEENRRTLPSCEYRALDLTKEVWPDAQRFDLVVCSEVLEHLADWQGALRNLVAMARNDLLITVPGGPRRAMDRLVGHVQHFEGTELTHALEALGCRVERVSRWGWPVHSAYKAAISRLGPDRLYATFSDGERYGFFKKAISELLYRLFFVNDLCGRGHQLIVHARVPRPGRPSTNGRANHRVAKGEA